MNWIMGIPWFDDPMIRMENRNSMIWNENVNHFVMLNVKYGNVMNALVIWCEIFEMWSKCKWMTNLGEI